MAHLAVLDYEMSNLHSVTKALERLGARVSVIDAPAAVEGFDGLVLPGVGNFGEAMRRLRAHRLDGMVAEVAAAGRPVLGICLGLQLLFETSEESPGVRGLGLIPGGVRRLGTERKLPHIGWCPVEWVDGAAVAPDGGGVAAATYYFVHSFACVPEDEGAVLGRADHGVRFCAAAGRGGVMGVQFHPEKSSAAGLGLLGRWLTTLDPGGAA